MIRRGQDSNLQSSGHEPDELTNYSTPLLPQLLLNPRWSFVHSRFQENVIRLACVKHIAQLTWLSPAVVEPSEPDILLPILSLPVEHFVLSVNFSSLMQLISSLIEGGTLLPNSKASPWGTSLPLGDSATKFKRKPPIKRLLLRPWDTKLPFLGD